MGMTDTDINAFNLNIRQTPWYQEWFQQRGLNPNQVKLNDRQRNELKALVEQQAGVQLPGDMKIDPAGNLNEKGGWAGLPTGVKIAIIGAAAVGTMGAAGVFGGAAGAASGAAGGTSAATGAGAAGAAGTAAGTGGSFLGALGGSKAALLGLGLSTAGKLAGGAADQRSQDRGAQAEYDLTRHGMEQQRIGTQNSQALQYATAKTGAEQNRMRQVASADMLGSMKTPTDPRARFDNGGRMSPETIAIMRDRAMTALESGSDVPTMQQTEATPQMPEGSGMDSFLNALRMGSTAVGALQESGLFNRPPPDEEVPRLNAANQDRVNEIYGKVRYF